MLSTTGAPGGITPVGPESLKQIVHMLTSAFPDHHTTLEEIIAEGNKVVVRAIFSGTHHGLFMGMAPTGKHISQQQIHVVRVMDGRAMDHRAVRLI
jgi:predicted ester cyclase